MNPPLSHSELYSIFRNQLRTKSLRLREPADFHEPIPISEKLVQVIWSDQLFDLTQLATRDGRSIQVLYPGRWNTGGGPDFVGAHLQIGNEPFRGDVEIHLHTTGWNEHHHSSDPAYNRVILDVCLWDLHLPARLYTQSGRPVPQLALHSHLQCSLEELAESLDPDRYPFSTNRLTSKSSPLLHLSPEEIAEHVNSAGVYRFEQKASRIAGIIQREGLTEAAYQLLAEALGYKHNKTCFRDISRALPLDRLLHLVSVESKIEALFLEADRHPLRLHQIRPANHPHRRLAALALLVHSHPNLFSWFHALLMGVKTLTQVPHLEHPFWSRHYHRKGKRLSQPISPLGSSRWKEIVTNVLLPFCYAEARMSGNTKIEKQTLKAYCEFPPSQSNRSSRQIIYDLGLPPPKKALFQQGLIQMYQDFELLFPEPVSTSDGMCETSKTIRISSHIA